MLISERLGRILVRPNTLTRKVNLYSCLIDNWTSEYRFYLMIIRRVIYGSYIFQFYEEKESLMSAQAIFEKSKTLGIVRILFGVVWAIDAWDKWQQGFLTTLPHSMSKHVSGQLPPAHAWIALWVNI